jgi:hypothetical protein
MPAEDTSWRVVHHLRDIVFWRLLLLLPLLFRHCLPHWVTRVTVESVFEGCDALAKCESASKV